MNHSRRFNPIQETDAAPNELAARLTALGVPKQATPSPTERPKPAARTRKITLPVPDYLHDALRERAFHQRCSLKHLVLNALIKDGYTVQPEDNPVDDRQSPRK